MSEYVKKILSVLFAILLATTGANLATAATSTAPSKAQSAVISKYMTAVETGDRKLLKSILHPSVKIQSTSFDALDGVKSFIDENDGFIKHVDVKIVKSGSPDKKLGQAFKLSGYLITATPEIFTLSKYSVSVYLLNDKGNPKFVTEKSAKNDLIEDLESVPEKTWTKVEKLLTDKYGKEYFELLAGESDDEIASEEAGYYYTADELIEEAQLEYKDLKYAKGVFTNTGSLFSQIVLSDTGLTSATFKFENTGPTDLIVSADGSGQDEVIVKAKSTKTITFEADPSISHLFIIRFDKDYDSKNSVSGKIAFKLSGLKAYTE